MTIDLIDLKGVLQWSCDYTLGFKFVLYRHVLTKDAKFNVVAIDWLKFALHINGQNDFKRK